MSFILDALKRADRERNRGAVPDIHAQSDGRPVAARDRAGRLRPWAWIALGAGLSVAAAMAWQSLHAPTAMQSAAVAGADSARSASTATAASGAASPSIAVPASTPLAPVPAPVAPLAPLAPANAARFLPTPAAVASAAALPAGAVIKTSGYSPAVTLQQAPDDVRRQLAALKLAGGVHSQRAADRLLIVDGQVVREGDAVAAGVVLEQIQPRSAIFRVREQRVEVPF